MNKENEILEYFPNEVKQIILKFNSKLEQLEEIHVRTNRNIILKIGQDELELSHEVTSKEVLEIPEDVLKEAIVNRYMSSPIF